MDQFLKNQSIMLPATETVNARVLYQNRKNIITKVNGR